MSHLLNSGVVGNIGLDHMKEIRKQTQEKWDSLGFLDGLKGHVKENVAQLFENQASSLLTEATDAANSGSFETVVFPIVRRVFSKLLANDIVSVQAMNMPIVSYSTSYHKLLQELMVLGQLVTSTKTVLLSLHTLQWRKVYQNVLVLVIAL